MSEEIIKVLDNICEKIGVAIDWSSENVWPYVLDVLGRYRIMEVINCSLTLIFIISIIAAIAFLFVKSIKGYMNEHEWWYDRGTPSPLSIIVWLVGSFIGFIMLLVLFNCIQNLLTWAVVPEIKYLDMLSKYV